MVPGHSRYICEMPDNRFVLERDVFSMQTCIKEMATFVTLEILTYVITDKEHEIEQIWKTLMDFYKK